MRDEPGLLVLWVTQDREAALDMALMYAKDSKTHGWWDRVRLLVWGPSAKVLSCDLDLQAGLQACLDAGVEAVACRACAERYEVVRQLSRLGIEVVYTGEMLTNALKDGWKVVSV